MHQTNKIGNLKILNSRETKHIIEKILEQYGCEVDLSQYAFLVNKDNRIYLISREIDTVPYDEMKIDSIGMYFGEMYKESLRLSIEGSQMVGPKATLNVVDISKEQLNEWVKGNDINVEEMNGPTDSRDFIILRHSLQTSGYTDYFGAGKFKDDKILNFVSKSRRLVTVNE